MMIEVEARAEKMAAEIKVLQEREVKTRAETIALLAKAEGEEKGRQIGEYKTALEVLEKEIGIRDGGTDKKSVQPVAGRPSDTVPAQ
jgi:hypothetical protein